MKSTIGKTSTALGALALALTMTASLARAQSPYPPASLLAAQWWQWALSIPCSDTACSDNPLVDPTGAFAAVNQHGRVWFLAGNLGGTTVRNINAPAGKALFFPIVNTFDVEDGIATHVEPAAGPGGTIVFMVKHPVQTAQGFVSTIIATATELSCMVDGSPLQISAANLEQSKPFSVFLPANNIVGVPAGVYFPFVDSGYYVLLPPLSPGQHTIHFAGTLTYFSPPVSVDVTDYITVQ